MRKSPKFAYLLLYVVNWLSICYNKRVNRRPGEEPDYKSCAPSKHAKTSMNVQLIVSSYFIYTFHSFLHRIHAWAFTFRDTMYFSSHA